MTTQRTLELLNEMEKEYRRPKHLADTKRRERADALQFAEYFITHGVELTIPKGYWQEELVGDKNYYICSNCGTVASRARDGEFYLSDFCPICGANMM